jgi:sporulation-specific protein 4
MTDYAPYQSNESESKPDTYNTTVNGTGDIPASLFVAHLTSYPAVAAVAGLAASFPVVKIFASNAIPVMMSLRDRSKPVSEPVLKRASPVISRVDKFGDEILTSVDKRFPSLQTTEPTAMLDMAKRPVESARSAANAYSDAARGTVNHHVVEPIKSATHAVRAQYAKVYDTQGKALIRSRVDPLFLAINDRLEAVIIDYLPKGDELPSNENLSNEMSRTWRLARTAIRRVRPALTEQAVNVSTIPQAARVHVKEIYERKVTEHSDGKNPGLFALGLAIIGTGRELTNEASGVVVSRVFASKPETMTTHTENGPVENDDENGSVSPLARAGEYIYNLISPAEVQVTDLAPSPGITGGDGVTTATQEVVAEGELHH